MLRLFHRSAALLLIPCLLLAPMAEAAQPMTARPWISPVSSSRLSAEALCELSAVFFHRFNARSAITLVSLILAYGTWNAATAATLQPTAENLPAPAESRDS